MQVKWLRPLLHITKIYMDDCFPCQLLDEQLELLETDKNFKLPFKLHHVNINDDPTIIKDVNKVPVLIFEDVDENASIPSDKPITYERIGTLVGYHQKDEIIAYIKDILKIKGYRYAR